MKVKSVVLQIARYFRRFVYYIYNRPLKGVLDEGISCQVEDPSSEMTHGDVIHPCVRYIEEGFEGHHWWMVYTPLYNWNDKLENPRLCYSDAEKGETPRMWRYYCTIKDCPSEGYNSDPTMLYYDGHLYIWWRECHTPRTKQSGCYYAVVGCCVKDHVVVPMNQVQMVENNIYIDKEVCPTVMSTKDGFRAYSLHQRYEPLSFHCLPDKLLRGLLKLCDIANTFRLYSRIKCRGVAIWNGKPGKPLKYMKTVPIKGVHRLFQPWHMDLFTDSVEENGMLYAVVQSNEKFADLYLTWSQDGEQFTWCDVPLIMGQTESMKGLYKSTAQVVDGVFYLFYTVQDSKDKALHGLYVTTMNWEELRGKVIT